jgi:hypothetical protein
MLRMLLPSPAACPQLTTDSGSISVLTSLVYNAPDEEGPAATVLTSNTGPIYVNTILSNGINVTSGGLLSLRALASGYLVRDRARRQGRVPFIVHVVHVCCVPQPAIKNSCTPSPPPAGSLPQNASSDITITANMDTNIAGTGDKTVYCTGPYSGNNIRVYVRASAVPPDPCSWMSWWGACGVLRL